ncbi:MAG: cob(I)yrinic acid a,c-diamide adenosyltransferase [Rectinemataceae bacterium]
MERGYVQVYTGEGKGKTTAAIGLCLRALGAGLSVYVGQFIKARPSAEIEALRAVPDARGSLETRQYGLGRFMEGDPSASDIEAARSGLADARTALLSGSFDLVVLDEICVAVARGLLEEGEVLDLVASKPESVELVLTGRYATQSVVAAADLVTEMRAVKHYHASGVAARSGIEL